MPEILSDINNYPPPGHHHRALHHDCLPFGLSKDSDKISYFGHPGVYVADIAFCVTDSALMVRSGVEGNATAE